MATTTITPERKVTKEWPAQNEAKMKRKKKRNPAVPPARETAENVTAAKVSERRSNEGREIRA
ncbi:hypothetical protein V2J09_010424 [Rumex salicifolius]